MTKIFLFSSKGSTPPPHHPLNSKEDCTLSKTKGSNSHSSSFPGTFAIRAWLYIIPQHTPLMVAKHCKCRFTSGSVAVIKQVSVQKWQKWQSSSSQSKTATPDSMESLGLAWGPQLCWLPDFVMHSRLGLVSILPHRSFQLISFLLQTLQVDFNSLASKHASAYTNTCTKRLQSYWSTLMPQLGLNNLTDVLL